MSSSVCSFACQGYRAKNCLLSASCVDNCGKRDGHLCQVSQLLTHQMDHRFMTANKQSCANLHIPAKEVEQHWQMLRDMKRICEKLHSIVTTWHSVLKALYSSMHTEVNKSLMIQLSTLCQPESQKHLRSISEASQKRCKSSHLAGKEQMQLPRVASCSYAETMPVQV